MNKPLYAWIFLVLVIPGTLASPLREGQPLPDTQIESLGELVLVQDDFDYRTWLAATAVTKPHVLQYFPGTLQDSKIYEPFTDSLQAQYALGTYHVTTIINLDEALWGTRGFVVSEVKRSKRKFPLATMVLDETGLLAKEWELGESGAGLVILDAAGEVRFVHLGRISDAEMAHAQAVFAELMTVTARAE